MANFLLSATMFDDGRISYLTRDGGYVRLDKDGKQVGTSKVGDGRLLSLAGFKCHFGADGGIVVPDYRANMVRAYDADGKEIWSASVRYPHSVTRLPSGDYVVLSRSTGKLVQLDRNGKETKSKYAPEGRVAFFERR